MTIPAEDVSRFRDLVRQIEQLVAGPAPFATVDPDGTPGRVAAGELIESAWGNATSDSVKFNKRHLSWSGGSFELLGGWGSGLKQIGTYGLPALSADRVYAVTFLVVAQYVCTGAAGSGADFSGGTCRTRFRVSPGVDSAVTVNRVGHDDQVTIVETWSVNRAPGAPATSLEVWAEPSKPCNISGGAIVTGIPLGGLA